MWWKIVGGLIVAFVVVSATGVFAAKPGTPEYARERERDVIGICWDDQKKKSLPPDQARFIASTCEMLEAKYRKEHGRNP